MYVHFYKLEVYAFFLGNIVNIFGLNIYKKFLIDFYVFHVTETTKLQLPYYHNKPSLDIPLLKVNQTQPI